MEEISGVESSLDLVLNLLKKIDIEMPSDDSSDISYEELTLEKLRSSPQTEEREKLICMITNEPEIRKCVERFTTFDSVETQPDTEDSVWQNLQTLSENRENLLIETAEVNEFANDVENFESQIAEKKSLVQSTDVGHTKVDAEGLLKLHKTLQTELDSYENEFKSVDAKAKALIDKNVDSLNIHFPSVLESDDTVKVRIQNAKTNYENLLKLAIDRSDALENAITLYAFKDDCNVLDNWIRDSKNTLNVNNPNETLKDAKLNYEKFKQGFLLEKTKLDQMDVDLKKIADQQHPQLEEAKTRAAAVHKQWKNLDREREAKSKTIDCDMRFAEYELTCGAIEKSIIEKSCKLEKDDFNADCKLMGLYKKLFSDLEAEVKPLREKVEIMNSLAESIRSLHPSKRNDVEIRQKEIQKIWREYEEKARNKRDRLESAISKQVLTNIKDKLTWMKTKDAELKVESTVKDIKSAKKLIENHIKLLNSIDERHDEINNIIEVGEQLIIKNPQIYGVPENIKLLETKIDELDKDWKKKDIKLKEILERQSNYKENRYNCLRNEEFLEIQFSGTDWGVSKSFYNHI